MNESRRPDPNAERELLQGKLSEVLPMQKVEIEQNVIRAIVEDYVVQFQELFSHAPIDDGIEMFVFSQNLRELQAATAEDVQLLDRLFPLEVPASELFVGNFFTEEQIAFYDSQTPWSVYIEALGKYMAGAYPKTG